MTECSPAVDACDTVAGMTKLACALLATGGLLVAAGPAQAHTLTYRGAMATAQARANAYAGQRATLTVRVRDNRHAYYVQAEWITIDPIGCTGCGLNPVTQEKFDTPGPVIRQVAMRVICIGRTSRAALRRPCAARAYVIRVLS